MLSTPIFKEIFSEMIEYLVERVQNNYALQVSNVIYYIALLCKFFVQENALWIDFILLTDHSKFLFGQCNNICYFRWYPSELSAKENGRTWRYIFSYAALLSRFIDVFPH